jgi:hypothetical protein
MEMPMTHKAGFPQDDQCSLQQGCYGDANLDVFYTHQFVQNEKLKSVNSDNGKVHLYFFEHTPIMAGTMTGIVYVGDQAVQTFCVSSSGVFTFTGIGEPFTYAVDGKLKLETGELELTMCHNTSPELVGIVASYEYNMETDNAAFNYTDQMVADMQADNLEVVQAGLMEMFLMSENREHRKFLLTAIAALDDVVFEVVKGDK